jgi:hypothetical protein
MIVANRADRRRLLEMKDERGLASLPIVEDWQSWWQEWGPRIVQEEGHQPWIIFLLDANEKLLELLMLTSRLIRNKPEWNTSRWTEKEWLNVAEQGAEARAWFAANHPNPDDMPEYAQFLLSGQHGLFCSLERVTRELRALQEHGFGIAVLDRSDVDLRPIECA